MVSEMLGRRLILRTVISLFGEFGFDGKSDSLRESK